MRPTIQMLCSMFLVAAAAVLGPDDTSAQELRYKFEEGEKLLLNMKQNMTMSFSAEGAPDTKTNMDQVTEIIWTVDEVQEDGTAKISQTVDRVRLNLTVPPNIDFQYDSASDEAPTGSVAGQMAPVLEALVGAKFDVTMNTRGEIVDLEVPDSLVDALQKSPNAAQMGSMFSRDGLEKMVQQGSLTFPEGELAPGREWKNSFEVASPGTGAKQTVTTSYRYLGQEEVDGETLDAFAVALDIDFGEGATPAGANVTVQNQESSGKIYFDRQAGRMKSSNIDLSMKAQIEAFGRTMTSQMDQHVEVTVTPAPESN